MSLPCHATSSDCQRFAARDAALPSQVAQRAALHASTASAIADSCSCRKAMIAERADAPADRSVMVMTPQSSSIVQLVRLDGSNAVRPLLPPIRSLQDRASL